MYIGSNAQEIIKKYGTGFYRSSLLFPKKVREEVWALYQFVRFYDEIVDTQKQDQEATLIHHIALFTNAYDQGIPSGLFIIDEFVQLMHKHKIPREYAESFFEAMKTDLSKAHYQTYQELEDYMYGSATVIGYMMSILIGCADQNALPHARALAEAFQMTNFLRDIKSDYEERHRIYMPREDMQRFGVTEEHIKQGINDDAWKAFVKFEIARIRTLYQKGVDGIHYLSKDGRKAVYAAALVYGCIQEQIEKADYDVFSRRIVVSPFDKTMLLLKALWKRNL